MMRAVERTEKAFSVILAKPNGQNAEHGKKKNGKCNGKGQEATRFQS